MLHLKVVGCIEASAMLGPDFLGYSLKIKYVVALRMGKKIHIKAEKVL